MAQNISKTTGFAAFVMLPFGGESDCFLNASGISKLGQDVRNLYFPYIYISASDSKVGDLLCSKVADFAWLITLLNLNAANRSAHQAKIGEKAD